MLFIPRHRSCGDNTDCYLAEFYFSLAIGLFILVLHISAKYFARLKRCAKLSTDKILKKLEKISKKKNSGFISIEKQGNRSLNRVLDSASYTLNFNCRRASKISPGDNLTGKDEMVLRLELSLKSGIRRHKKTIISFAEAHNLPYEVSGFIRDRFIWVRFPNNLAKSADLIFSMTTQIFGPDTDYYQIRASR